MFDFEKIHKNKKRAFLDGFLIALCLTWLAVLIKKVVDEPVVPWLARVRRNFTA